MGWKQELFNLAPQKSCRGDFRWEAGWGRAQKRVVSPPKFVRGVIDYFMPTNVQDISSIFLSKTLPLLYSLNSFL